MAHLSRTTGSKDVNDQKELEENSEVEKASLSDSNIAYIYVFRVNFHLKKRVQSLLSDFSLYTDRTLGMNMLLMGLS